MTPEQIITSGAEIIGSLALFAFGAGYLSSKFKSGTKEQKSENTDLISSNDQIKQFYKDQNDDYKKIIAQQTADIHDLNRRVGEMKGQLEIVQAQNKEYLAILQNRNPEMDEFMKFMIKATENQAVSQKEMIRILGEIHIMTKAEHERDFKVEATVTKQ